MHGLCSAVADANGGTIYIIDRARVHPVDVPVTTMFKCISKWGTGAGDLLADMPRETSETSARDLSASREI